MRVAIRLYSSICIGIVASACSSDVERVPIGEPCSREDDTLCDSLCLLDLPNGMCSHDCSEDESVCPEGFVCGDISEGRYCLMSCVADDGCREGMICVVGQCRTPVGWGQPCEEHADCQSNVCHEGACNRECHGPNDCPDGLTCLYGGGDIPLCLEYSPPPDGPGTSGDNCTTAECADDHDCISRTARPANDPNAFCARSCLNELDCPLDMTCRRTQLSYESNPVLRCVPRELCERCAYDGQCGFDTDRCVSQNPLRGRGRYCSRSCDPESPGTCPTDTSCHEALWCEADQSWVADCSWCSDEGSCEPAEGGPVHQCFHDYGSCAGDGSEYCAPCYVDADCPDGGVCWFDQYFANNFCTMPCPMEGGAPACPREHSCYDIDGFDEPQCLPRQGSCSEPSGGVTTCYPCDGPGDCVSGFCLQTSPTSRTMHCLEDCPRGDTDCPPFTVCELVTLNTGSGSIQRDLCIPPRDWSCVHVQYCQEECPDGEGECPSDAREHCRDY